MLSPTTPAGRQGLAAILADPLQALVALDYDGTLAPIVARPQDAVPAPGAVQALTALALRVGCLALVTGRPADVVVDLGGLTGVPGLVVLGQYGAQRWQGGVLEQPVPVAGVAEARRVLLDLALEAGVAVEDKGLSLVVHTRRAADPAGALDRLRGPLTDLAGQVGLELHGGRLALELRPPGYDKGAALLGLSDGRSAVLFAGDDVGDLAAYDAVDRLRVKGTPGLLVCSDSAETPSELRDRADLVVDGPPGVVQLVEQLVRGFA